MAGLYIHIPICRSKCNYCDFYSVASAQGCDLADALRREMEERQEELDEPLKTLYFGGGTPSLLSAGEVKRLMNSAGRLWDVSGLEEATLEVNPDDVTAEWLDGVLSAGINRLSIGIQSFDDAVLHFLGRRHTAQKAVDAVSLARRAGIENISIDLIYGIPGMNLGQWQASVEKALRLDPEHISAYHLTLEAKTPFENLQPVTESVSVEQYRLLCSMLNGYEHYEISNFALPGFRSKHNSS